MRLQCDQCLSTPLIRNGRQYVCDFTWKIDVQASCVRIQQGMVEIQKSLPLADISNAFVQTIAELGIPVVVPHLPKIVNLCKEHWALAPDLGADYANDPAKTADNGIIYLCNVHKEFTTGGTPDLDKIRSTCVHELMHSWSDHHTGLQSFHYEANVEFDECVADMLGRKVYCRSRTGNVYKTGYGNMSEFIKSQFDTVFHSKISAWKLPKIRSEVPGTCLKQAFDNLRADTLDERYRGPFYWEFARWFVTWFLKGPQMPVHGRTVQQFRETALYSLFFGTTDNTRLGYGTPAEFATGAPAEFTGPAAPALAA